MTRVSVIVLAWRSEPLLERCVESLLGSRDVDPEVIIVDNGCDDGSVDRVSEHVNVRVLRPGRNLGFAGGCNFGVAHADGDVVVLINSDAYVEPQTLARLATAAQAPDVGIATASIRLAEDPSLLNSAGNPIHFLGFSWAGGFGDPATSAAKSAASASGAGLAMRRSLWEQLGGFCDEYFAYQEDAELSWRAWQVRKRVAYVPDAIVIHHYETSRNVEKRYLVERNRLLFVLTVHGRRLLLLLLPVLIVTELAMLVASAMQGWWRQKLAGWAWVARNASWVVSRRRYVQRSRAVSDRDLAPLLADRLELSNFHVPAASVVNALFAAYWRVVRSLPI